MKRRGRIIVAAATSWAAIVRPGSRDRPNAGDAGLHHCCAIETTSGQIHRLLAQSTLTHRADHLNIEVPDLLAQRVPVHPEELGRLDLVAARCRESGPDEGF